MQGKELHDFLFQLYDYADHLAEQIRPDGDSFLNDNYFLTLVMIEKFFDRIGRHEISAAAKESAETNGELNASSSLSEAHKRIDLLRGHISRLAQEYDFNETLDHASRQLATEWHKQN